ncbi:PilW family protein [Acinetobacter schindleri]|uniref:PilW family protein n=1 Tax=Acinetobacter sp. YH12208 TaxID=2601144 RepID=UPI0015D39506|nr:PilW family protein [Acinetobacter sp. YH12208]UOH75314.1 PilW family protein [Acinetobacter schindleri]
MRQQNGYTLMELLIALTLGLVIVAAATMLFLTGVRSQAMQQGVADLQDNANFGLNYITQDLRLANLNNLAAEMNDQLLLGGIVLSQNNYPNPLRPQPDPANPTAVPPPMNQILLSSSGSGLTNVAQGSDQLVIQYQPMTVGGFDCEGREITNSNRIIVQRYFLRTDANQATGETNPLALACDAGHYAVGDNTVTNYGDAGEIIMKRVDYFRVLLNVANATGAQRYVAINNYLTLTPRPRILGVSLGVLTRSAQSVGTDQAIAQNNNFTVLDQTVQVTNTGNPNGYMRRVVTQDVALRNALGEREEVQDAE